MKEDLAKKIVLLNQTTQDSLAEKDNLRIIKNFTETGIKIIGADFGWAWWKFYENEEFKLAYKSPTTPYAPDKPRERAGNYTAIKTKKPFIASGAKKEDFPFPISKYMKSYVIVPIFYNEYAYGSLVLCFKKKHLFKDEEMGLLVSLGNATAQAITIHRLLEREHELAALREAKRLLEEEKLKTEFIANATHEIRTPLAIIKGNVDLGLTKDIHYVDVLKAINHETEHLSRMLSDLSILCSTAGKVKNKINFEKVCLPSVIGHTAKNFKVIADQKRISIKVNKIPDVALLGDEAYLEKMFANLLRNAVTYGREGGRIEISAMKKKDAVEIKISDNGIGISEKDLPHIFERFYRANKSHVKETQSVGLGLAIVKWIVTAHKGTISAKSQVGKGTTFTISFPVSN